MFDLKPLEIVGERLKGLRTGLRRIFWHGLPVLGVLGAVWFASTLLTPNADALIFPGLGKWFGFGLEPRSVDLTIWQERDYLAMNRVFESVQGEYDPEVLKAIAWVESRWRHVRPEGAIFVTANYKWEQGRRTASLDWGWMQINERLESLNTREWDLERIKHDPEYNLRAAVATLESKRRYLQRLRRKANWPALEAKYRLKGHSDLDLLLKAYNGFQPSWAYVNRVRAALAEKPWERAMLAQLRASAVRPEVRLSGLAVHGPEHRTGGDLSRTLVCTGPHDPAPLDPAAPVYTWPQVLE